MAELGIAGRITQGARSYTWRAPRWLPLALLAVAILWGAGIWWMIGNLGGDGAAADPAVEQAADDEVAVLRAKVDSLAQQASSLVADRDALAQRVAALEARPAAAPPVTASPATQATVSPAPPPAIVPMALEVTPAAYSIPHFAYRATADPSTAAPATAASPTTSTAATARFFTNGADVYNCTSFASQAEAQQALAINAPGDPNHLDMNANGVACEDITYTAGTPRNVTPILNR